MSIPSVNNNDATAALRATAARRANRRPANANRATTATNRVVTSSTRPTINTSSSDTTVTRLRNRITTLNDLVERERENHASALRHIGEGADVTFRSTRNTSTVTNSQITTVRRRNLASGLLNVAQAIALVILAIITGRRR